MQDKKINFYRDFGTLSNDSVTTDIYQSKIKEQRKRKNKGICGICIHNKKKKCEVYEDIPISKMRTHCYDFIKKQEK